MYSEDAPHEDMMLYRKAFKLDKIEALNNLVKFSSEVYSVSVGRETSNTTLKLYYNILLILDNNQQLDLCTTYTTKYVIRLLKQS